MCIDVVAQKMLSIFKLQMKWDIKAGLPIFMQPRARQNPDVETGNVEEDTNSIQHVDTNIDTNIAISAGPDQTVIDVVETSTQDTNIDTNIAISAGPDQTVIDVVETSTQNTNIAISAGPDRTVIVVVKTSTQATSINEWQRVANWATGISGTGIISVMAGFLGNQASKPTHHFLFLGYLCSMMGSFVLGISIFIFSTIFSQSSVFCVVIKILVVIAVASIAMAVGFAAALCFDKA